MTLEYYVYVLLDSSKPGDYKYGDYVFNYEPFYIGKGKSNRIKETLNDKSPFKMRKIKKLKSKNIEIITEKVVDGLSNDDAIKNEIYLIHLIGRRDLKKGTLVNMTDGGDGRVNSSHSLETKQKISINRTGKGIGWKHSDFTKNMMSDNQSGEGNGFFGHSHTEKVRNEQSNRVSGVSHPMYDKKHSSSTIERLKEHRRDISNESIKEACQIFNKPVLMYDLSLNFIMEFDSVKSASTHTNINESIISKCCRGDIKSPTRYYFRYKNKQDNIKNNKFLISVGDSFIFNNIPYKLVKRNRKTCTCECDDDLVTLHVNDFGILFEKETNNIDIVEIFLFLKAIDSTFRIHDDLIFNKNIKIRYINILSNCEVFNRNIYDDESDILIFSDEWELKKDIVKSRLNNFLKKSKKVWARNCDIREITDNSLVREFLLDNHIQGFVGSKIKLGLFHNDELLSLMSFGNLRKNLGLKSKSGSWELLRFCNKKYISVVGGASKLYKYFLDTYQPNYIMSYADRRWSNGGLYKNLKFQNKGITIPNYYYIIDNKREYRFKFRKDILVKRGYDVNKTEVEILNEMGYYRIFDKGSIKYEFYNI